MPDLRESIDEMIEESYLLGMNESEIKADLDRFVEICGRVIYENVRDRKQMHRLTEKLARARALSLIEDHPDPTPEPVVPGEERSARSARERFVERVARNKRLIMKAIMECDPKLESLIEQARFPATDSEAAPATPSEDSRPKPKFRDLFLKTCYAVSLLIILLLIYLALLQNV